MITREQIQGRIDVTLEELLSEIYLHEKITDGDISPEQTLRWNELRDAFSALFEELILQNKE